MPVPFSLAMIAFEFEPDWNAVLAAAIRVGLILAGAAVAWGVLRTIRRRVSAKGTSAAGSLDEVRQRRQTLASVVTAAGTAVIVSVALMMILEELGMDLAPLLATAGVAGLAIGFGAQTLVKDIIGGIFILLENQYAIGDVVQAAGVDGVVERVNLRTTILRDVYGVVHVVPNGEIRVLSNKTKGWSRAVLDIGVGYGEDPDRVIAVLEEVGRDIVEDPVYGALLLETPTVPGVESFGESSVTIRMMARTLPLKQWDVARELRRRIKHRFDEEGIELPFPQRTVWQRKAEED